MTDCAHAQFGFSFPDVTINVLAICCQILVMSSLAFSLCDVTIDVYLTHCVGGWIQFGITARVRHNKMAFWAKQLRNINSAPRILRMLLRPPANFRQSFAYFWAILCEPCSQKSRFFLVQRNFPLYTRGLLGCLLGFWPMLGQRINNLKTCPLFFNTGDIYCISLDFRVRALYKSLLLS